MNIIQMLSKLLGLFRQIIITSTLKSIRQVFQLGTIDLICDPSYQRNYVWTKAKATYLIESILLHAEIPPVVVYVSGNRWEVIDGRQRCETIILFLKDGFKLKANGLDKLWNLADKKFSDLDPKLKDRLQDTRLRFIQIQEKDEGKYGPLEEGMIKREIFKRSNMGMTPLKKEEVTKAQYLHDAVNDCFKSNFERDSVFLEKVTQLFGYRIKNIEKIMLRVRQLLVLPYIPINRFVNEREDIVNKSFEYLSYNIGKNDEAEDVSALFEGFRRRLDYLESVKALLDAKNVISSRPVFECLYWALSVSEMEGVQWKEIHNPTFMKALVIYLARHISEYTMERSNFSQTVKKQYGLISAFFASRVKVSFSKYLQSDEHFLKAYREKIGEYMKERYAREQGEVKFSKMNPTSSSIVDILDNIKRERFCIRPPYQRAEVIDYAKASSLIESILMGLKLNPIFVYLREDGVTEVIDGQQRLLAIIGFIGQKFRNEKGELVAPKKNNFPLKLKSDIFPHLKGKKFSQLPQEYRDVIMNLDIDIIEIKENDNRDFKPEDLFKRLNHKPFPIYNDTFEYWNAYVDHEIIEAVKDICRRNAWLHLKRADPRMHNEELITCLCYLHYMTGMKEADMLKIKDVLRISRTGFHLSVGIKNKELVTRILEEPGCKGELLRSFIEFENEFVGKVRVLVSNTSGKVVNAQAYKQLNTIFQVDGFRKSRSFYVLWLALKGLSIDYISAEKAAVLDRLNRIFTILKTSDSPQTLEDAIIETWASDGWGEAAALAE